MSENQFQYMRYILNQNITINLFLNGAHRSKLQTEKEEVADFSILKVKIIIKRNAARMLKSVGKNIPLKTDTCALS